MATGASETYLAYTKIGRLVHVSGNVTLVSESSPSGNMKMSLPFTVGNLSERAGNAWGDCYWSAQGGTIVNGGMLYCYEGNAFAYFVQISDAGTFSYISDSTLDANFNKLMRISVTYLV